MTKVQTIDPDEALAAFDRRDRTADGRFVVAVRTTRIYCKPSCPARRPRRENVALYRDGAAARAAGYRACLRCRPDAVSRDTAAVARARDLLDRSPMPLAALAAAVGYAPHHFHRLFRRVTGLTPAAYARTARVDRLGEALGQGEGVSAAIYDAGYAAPSRAYADAAAAFGMTPGAWAAGGAGAVIRFAVLPTGLGPLLVAATERGLCRIAFDEGEGELGARFPRATILPADAATAALADRVAALVDDPAAIDTADLPVDVPGTAFQMAIWQALRRIPAGTTQSYADLASAAGRPAAIRAAGSACGDNHLAVLVPCHRVLRSDGTLGGYAYGLDRKAELLARESGAADTSPG